MSSGGELRQNVVTGRWVVVAPARGDRPVEWPEAEREARPLLSETCPFCPGNEDELPAILQELAAPDDPGWLTRVVPNRYPAFAGAATENPGEPGEAGAGEGVPEEGPGGAGADDGATVRPGRALPATGAHEVVIETPRHDVDLADMSGTHAEAVVGTWRERYAAHAAGEAPRHVSLFRNEGREAGTSLVHAHAQLVATAFQLPAPARRDRRMRAYHAERGACLLCSLPDAEPGAEARTVFRGEHLTAWVPWAPEAPLEVWVAPRRHAPSFDALTDDERGEVARVLVSLARAYRERGGDPDFNLLLHSSARSPDDPALHWFFQIRPRAGRAAGFELLTSVTINSSQPLGDASLIRESLRDPPASHRETRT